MRVYQAVIRNIKTGKEIAGILVKPMEGFISGGTGEVIDIDDIGDRGCDDCYGYELVEVFKDWLPLFASNIE